MAEKLNLPFLGKIPLDPNIGKIYFNFTDALCKAT